MNKGLMGKILNGAKKIVLPVAAGMVMTLGIAKMANADPLSFRGYVNGNAAGCSTKITIKPVRPQGYAFGVVDSNGYYSMHLPETQPPLRGSDTLDFKGWRANGSTYTKRTADSLSLSHYNLQTFLNGFGVNVRQVRDISGVIGNIIGTITVGGQSYSAPVDTHGTKFTDYAVNVPNAQHGAYYSIRFEKQGAQGHSLVTGTVDTTKGRAQVASNYVLFPAMTEAKEVLTDKTKLRTNALEAIFDISGRKLNSAPKSGIYFKRYKDGTVKKIVRLN